MSCSHVRYSLAVAILLSPLLSALGYEEGAPPGYSGAPPNLLDCTSCHASFPLNSGPGGTNLLQIPTQYAGMQNYAGRVLIGHTGMQVWGFELAALDTFGQQAGVLYLHPGQGPFSRIVQAQGTDPDYLTHTRDGSYPGQMYGVWDFNWFSPPGSVGPITFSIASLAGDGDGSEAGDYVYAVQRTSAPASSSDPDTPHLLVPQPSLSYGLTPIGATRSDTLLLYGAGNQTLMIESTEFLSSNSFSFGSPVPGSLHPGDLLRLTVNFTPQLVTQFRDTLRFETNSLFQPTVEVYLFGSSTEPLPPEPFGLIHPQDGASVGGGTVLFRWQSTQNRDSSDTTVDFTLELSLESDFQEVERFEVGSDTQVVLTTDGLIDHRLYFWRVYAHDTNTEGTWSTNYRAFLTDLTNAVDDESIPLPEGWHLHDPYPNPFNAVVRIGIQVQHQAPYTARIFDLLGREVETLHNGLLHSGHHALVWRPDCASGVYLLRVTTPGSPPQVRKLLYIR